jgi:phosphonate transport system ATP-binding protein
LNRLHDPTSGEVIFSHEGEKTDLAQIQGRQIRSIRKKIGMIFQHFNLIPRHSVLSNVLMGRLAETGTWRSLFGFFQSQDKEKALQYLNLVGISDKARIRADQLSGGQQQRVAIARALTQDPALLLADEPVASLDPATCHTVMDYLKKVNQELGITIICNLHFLSLVRQYATRVIALKSGEIVFEGDPKEINEAWFEKIYGQGAKEVHVN